MRNIILILYSVVAVAGVYMFALRLMKKEVKLIMGILHGFTGLIGIALLIVLSSYSEQSAPVISIILFFLAFLVGGAMFVARTFGRGSSGIWIVVAHAALAASGIYFLFFDS